MFYSLKCDITHLLTIHNGVLALMSAQSKKIIRLSIETTLEVQKIAKKVAAMDEETIRSMITSMVVERACELGLVDSEDVERIIEQL